VMFTHFRRPWKSPQVIEECAARLTTEDEHSAARLIEDGVVPEARRSAPPESSFQVPASISNDQRSPSSSSPDRPPKREQRSAVRHERVVVAR
jgi:hypothetical protein